jgi:hypothetical protein
MSHSRPASVRARQLLLPVLLPLCLSFLNHSGAEGAGWVQSPASRNGANSLNAVTLIGYVDSPNQTITFTIVDQNSGNPVALASTATSAATGTSYKTSSGSGYTLYAWTIDAGVLAANYWAPQFQNLPPGSPVPNLAVGQGRLEIVASAGGTQLSTFSQAALDLFLVSSKDPETAAAIYADGTTTVLFAQNGVGFGPETPWVNIQGMISTPPGPPSPPYLPVAWSVGSYSVEGGTKKIYALICSPSSGGPYPVAIYNHGGVFSFNGGNVSGMVTSSGWTSAPKGVPDGLGQCIDWAKRGWVFATSSYRGESIKITSSSTDFAAGTWTSGGNPELCLGEVTDVMALTDLIVNHASSISDGSTGALVPLNVNGKVLMYGYSHGGCVTYRAVEQGAPVTAFAVIEGFTDFILGYLNGIDYLTFGPPHQSYQTAALAAAQGSFAFTSAGVYYPDTNGVMGYNWRSAHYFASRGDLSIQKFKTMPILIFHGDVDYYINPLLPTGSNPVYLNEATEMAAGINAANIFVGPAGSSPPTSEPCMSGPVGVPVPNGLAGPTGSCAIAFMPMDTGDSCMTMSATALPFSPGCVGLPLPLTPLEPHYLVVYDKMDHVNGGLAIKNTFSGFVLANFGAPPGCNGLETQCN